MTRPTYTKLPSYLCLTLLFILLPTQAIFAQSRCPPLNLSPQARIGVNVARDARKEITDYAVEQINAGWYLDYTWHRQPPRPNGMTYFPMLRTNANLTKLATDLGLALAQNPGQTWILGNEPDNWAQDRRTPAEFATFYHTFYHFIKARDPSSRIAMAAVTAVTPLRLRYLDAVLASYRAQYQQELPADLWTVHIYLLSETDQGGIGLPPGLETFAGEAIMLEQADHDNLQAFAAQVRTFRAWMAAHGFRNHELMLSEYGILLPPSHGFGEERVRNFLLGTFAYLQTARDERTGLPADDNRLVQRWGWFSLNFYAYNPAGSKAEQNGLNGNLFDHGSGAITPLGTTFRDYMTRLTTRTVDLAVVPSSVSTETIAITIVNQGDAAATGFRLRLWSGTRPVGVITSDQPLAPHCATQLRLPLSWQTVPAGTTGNLRLQVLPRAGQFEYDPTDNWQ